MIEPALAPDEVGLDGVALAHRATSDGLDRRSAGDGPDDAGRRSPLIRVGRRRGLLAIGLAGTVGLIAAVFYGGDADTPASSATGSSTTTEPSTTITTRPATTAPSPVPTTSAAPAPAPPTEPPAIGTTPPPSSDAIQRIVWLGENPGALCLASTSPLPNTPVRVAPCRDDPSMSWQLDNGQLRGGEGDLCLARMDNNNSTPVRAVTCNADSEMQSWRVEGDTLVNTAPAVESCLEMDGDVHLLYCIDGDDKQMWQVS